MKVISSYRVEIRKLHKPLKQTMAICRQAVSWLLPVIEGEWEALSVITREKLRFNAAEKMIHSTKKNQAEYPFDSEFPKMPSYLRRAVLQHVIGEVSSAHTNAVLRGEVNSKDRKRETSSREICHYMPVFYKDNMYTTALSLWTEKPAR